MADESPFEIGLVMAGAVSAGAYSAGVYDYLVESLDAWYAAKAEGVASCPPHEVRLKVMAGASAGAMVSSIATVVLSQNFPHVRVGTTATDPDGQRNALFDAWVNRIDISGLLQARDLADVDKDGSPARVRSLLDSTALDDIGTRVFQPGAPLATPRPYLANPLHTLVTLTNLRGVPYNIDFTGLDVRIHRMNLHADSLHFTLGSVKVPGAVSLPAAVNGVEWDLLRAAAIASGAFPVGLAPRALVRDSGDYHQRDWFFPGSQTVRGVRQCGKVGKIDPDFGAPPESFPYHFLCVDGGVMDNEPFGLARATLTPDDPMGADHSALTPAALVMIDPFPDADPFKRDDDFHNTYSLYRLLPRIVRSLIDQTRFKPAEVTRALDPDVYNQFLITPTRYEADGITRAKFDIATGGLGGFAGFLHRDFRDHDFHLGRLNCQRFLQRHFLLPEHVSNGVGNPLFAKWDERTRSAYRVWRDASGNVATAGATEARSYLPIIPVLKSLPNLPAPVWPTYPSSQLDVLRRGMKQRAQLVTQRLIDKIDGWFTRRLLSNAWWLKRGDYVEDLVGVVREDLSKRNLLA